MADIRAIASGNWSAGATWNGGVPPGVGDNAFANGFTVTIDTSKTCTSVNTTAGGGGVAGGGFTLADGATLTANVTAGTTPCVTFSAAYPATAGVVATTITGGSSASSVGVNHTGSGHIVVSASSGITAGAGVVSYGFQSNNTNGTFAVTGNITATAASPGVNIATAASGTINGNITSASTGATGIGVQLTTVGDLTVTGNVTSVTALGINASGNGGLLTVNGNAQGGTATGANGITVGNGQRVLVNGNATGGSGTQARGVSHGGYAEVRITGVCLGGTGSQAHGAEMGTQGTLSIGTAQSNNYPNDGVAQATPGAATTVANAYGTFDAMVSGSGGAPPLSGRWFVNDAASNSIVMRQANAGATTTLVDVPSDYPEPEDVRRGVSYDFGALVGTMDVPPAEAVRKGVAVDSGTGTALQTDAQIGADAWDYSPGSYPAGSMGERLSGCATIDSTGAQIAAFGA